MKILLAMTLAVLTQSAVEREQQKLLRHDDHETPRLVDEDDDEDERDQLKQSTRRLRPESSAKYSKSAKSDKSSVTFPTDTDDVPTPAPIPVQGSPPFDPTRERSTTDSDYFVNFPTGFDCDPVPFFMDRNVNPSTAFNGLYPQLIPNGFDSQCTLRLLPDIPSDVAASAMQSFSFNPGNTDMQFRMEVGTLFFGRLTWMTGSTKNDQRCSDSTCVCSVWKGYRLYSATNGYAEGMAIVIHQDPDGTRAIGGTGPNLGVYGGINDAVVIELDTG
jgi:hypothetical protein